MAHLQNRYFETETMLIISNFLREFNLKHSGFVKCSQVLADISFKHFDPIITNCNN